MPTIKQKMAAAKLLGNHGNISKTMREVGYSENTVNTPGYLTESQGWQELMAKQLPDSMLMRKHRALLNKKESIVSFENGRKTVTKTKEVDPFAVSKGLELAYKIKGKYTDSNSLNIGELKVTVNDP